MGPHPKPDSPSGGEVDHGNLLRPQPRVANSAGTDRRRAPRHARAGRRQSKTPVMSVPLDLAMPKLLRAIYYPVPISIGSQTVPPELYENTRGVMIDLLKALREPSADMANAGGNCLIPDRDGQPGHAAEAWRAMIDVLLKELG